MARETIIDKERNVLRRTLKSGLKCYLRRFFEILEMQ